MPIYEYRCERGHHFDALQSISDDPLSECEQCGAPVQKVMQPVAVHFKGSGFYSTDYGAKKKAAESNGSGSESKDSGEKKESKPEKSSNSSGTGSSDSGSKSD